MINGSLKRGFAIIRSTLFWRPYNEDEDPTTSGTILGSPCFGNSQMHQTLRYRISRIFFRISASVLRTSFFAAASSRIKGSGFGVDGGLELYRGLECPPSLLRIPTPFVPQQIFAEGAGLGSAIENTA